MIYGISSNLLDWAPTQVYPSASLPVRSHLRGQISEEGIAELLAQVPFNGLHAGGRAESKSAFLDLYILLLLLEAVFRYCAVHLVDPDPFNPAIRPNFQQNFVDPIIPALRNTAQDHVFRA